MGEGKVGLGELSAYASILLLWNAFLVIFSCLYKYGNLFENETVHLKGLSFKQTNQKKSLSRVYPVAPMMVSIYAAQCQLIKSYRFCHREVKQTPVQ